MTPKANCGLARSSAEARRWRSGGGRILEPMDRRDWPAGSSAAKWALDLGVGPVPPDHDPQSDRDKVREAHGRQ